MRANSDELDVKTLIASTILAQTIASKIFEVYSPALFAWQVGCKVMLGAGRPLAYFSDLLSDFNGQVVYVFRIPRIIPDYGAGFRDGREFTTKQKAKSQQ